MDAGRQPGRAGASIHRLALLSAGVFGVLVLAAIAALLLASSMLTRHSETIAQDTRAFSLSQKVEVQLLNYQRLADLEALSGADLGQDRLQVRGEMRELLDELHGVAGPRDRELLDDLARQLAVYFASWSDAEARGLSPPERLQVVGPFFDRALTILERIEERNEQQADLGLAQAHRVNLVANLSGAAAGILLVAGLVSVVFGVRAYVLGPIGNLHEAIDRFRDGDPAARARLDGPVEMGAIGEAFNELADELVRAREQRLAFLGGVAHDLRNPLGAMKLGIGGLRALPAVAADGRAHRLLSRFDRQIDRLTLMLGDLVDATRIEAGRLELSLEEVDVGEAARDMVELYAPTSPDHRVELEPPDDPVIVRGDPLRIEQVISNLLSNAIKYSIAGGRVTVAVRADQDAGEAEIAVEDRGVGIAPEEIATIFQPFRRRPGASGAPGAGLGLSVVKRIVEAHGGRIEIESVPGEGSTFRVRLPVHAGAGELSAPRRAS